MSNIKYPYSRPNINSSDIEAVKRVLNSQFLTQGPVVKSFEQEIEKKFSVKNCKKCAAAWLPLVQHVSPLPLLILTLETNEGFPQDMIGNDVAELFLELGQQLKFRCDRPIVSITPYLWQPSYEKSM